MLAAYGDCVRHPRLRAAVGAEHAAVAGWPGAALGLAAGPGKTLRLIPGYTEAEHKMYKHINIIHIILHIWDIQPWGLGKVEGYKARLRGKSPMQWTNQVKSVPYFECTRKSA